MGKESVYFMKSIHVRHCPPECLKNHLAVLLTNYLVSGAACRVDALLTDRLDLGEHLRRLRLQDALEDADGMVAKVGHRLIELTLRRHIDGLYDKFLRIPAKRPILYFCNHVVDLILR